MKKIRFRFLSAAITVIALFLVSGSLAAQTTSGSSESRFALESTDLKVDAPVMKNITLKHAKPRLPNYYASVVTQKQRDDIRAIQNEYLPLIDILSARLDALRNEMNEKTRAVLSDEQRMKVERTAEDARAKRRSNRTAAE